MSKLRATSILVLMCCIVTGGLGLSYQADAQEVPDEVVAQLQQPPPELKQLPWEAGANQAAREYYEQVQEYVKWYVMVIDYVTAVAEQARQAAAADAARRAAAASAVTRARPAGSVPAATSGGHIITQQEFANLAQCEHSGTNGSLYGYYSIMDPRAGSLSMAEQQAWAQDIYNRNGNSAWSGCAHNLP